MRKYFEIKILFIFIYDRKLVDDIFLTSVKIDRYKDVVAIMMNSIHQRYHHHYKLIYPWTPTYIFFRSSIGFYFKPKTLMSIIDY